MQITMAMKIATVSNHMTNIMAEREEADQREKAQAMATVHHLSSQPLALLEHESRSRAALRST